MKRIIIHLNKSNTTYSEHIVVSKLRYEKQCENNIWINKDNVTKENEFKHVKGLKPLTENELEKKL